jgi:cytidine deaminase
MTDSRVETGKDAAELLEVAHAARVHSYSPFSRFRVGAAVYSDRGTHTGTNLDNASFPVSVCAEQSAVAAAINAGSRHILAVALAGDAESLSPCGKCRQLIAEFSSAATPVTLRWGGESVTVLLGDLVPYGFTSTS